MNIRPKLLISLGIPFMVSTVVSFAIIINITTSKVGTQLKNQLDGQESALVRQVSDMVLTSARSYISAVGKVSNKRINEIYKRHRMGEISISEAETLAKAVLRNEKFLDSGYIYTVDEKGVILDHPDVNRLGKVSTAKEWLLKQDKRVNSYYNYEYEGRDKVLYKIYNKDFKWNIMVSAYADDFSQSLDRTELNKTVNNIKIGRNGYPILLTSSGLIVTHPNSKLIGKSGLLLQDADGNKLFQKIIKEKEGTLTYNWEEEDGRVEEKFIFFKYEKNSKLIVCATGYTSDFYSIVTSIYKIIIVSGAVMLIILSTLLYFISTSVSKPVRKFNLSLKDISEGEGDLTERIEIKSSGEIGVMVTSFNSFLNTLQDLITKIKGASDKTVLIKEEVSAGVDETAAALHEISTNIAEIKKQTNNLNDNVQNSADASDDIFKAANDLDKSVETQSVMLQTSTAAITEMISSIENVDNITSSKKETAKKLLVSAQSGAADISDTQNAVKDVNNQLENIQEMAEVISNIASQTNLLAMNAAIEAAHAGDAGKGFAVVADEIRKLAENSSSNSSRISETLKDIAQSIISADELSEKTMQSFGELNKEITEMVDALTEITASTNELQIGGKDILESITGLEEASSTVRQRASTIKELSTSVKKSMVDTSNISLEVVTSIDEINEGTTGISESMNLVMDNTYKLKDTSDELKTNVGRFKV